MGINKAGAQIEAYSNASVSNQPETLPHSLNTIYHRVFRFRVRVANRFKQ